MRLISNNKCFYHVLLFLVMLSVTGSGCSKDSSSGGAGADFDETMYYTKTQTDDKLQYKVNFEPANGSKTTITSTGFANGASFTVPSGFTWVRGLFVEVYLRNQSSSTKIISLVLTSTNSPGSGGAYIVTLPAGAHSKQFVFFPPSSATAGSTVVLWQDPAQAYGEASTDLTNVTIEVTPNHWIGSK